MRVAPVAVLLLLVVLAGCSMPLSGGDTTTETTITPAEVPDRPPISVGQGFETLLASHEAALNDTAVAVRAQYPDPSGQNVTTLTGFAGRNESVYSLDVSFPNGRLGRWSNGTVEAVVRSPRDEEPTYDVHPVPEFTPAFRTLFLRPVLEHAVVTAVDASGDGYVVTGSVAANVTEDSYLPDEDIENATATLQVTADGVIERFRFSWDYAEDADGRVSFEQVVFDRNATTLPRPAWVSTALENATVEDFRTTTVVEG